MLPKRFYQNKKLKFQQSLSTLKRNHLLSKILIPKNPPIFHKLLKKRSKNLNNLKFILSNSLKAVSNPVSNDSPKKKTVQDENAL